MNNLEKMKSQIIKKIEQMDCDEFGMFTDELAESVIDFDVDSLFTCEKCREKYGECNSGDEYDCNIDICSKRFEKHCMEECS